MCKKGGERGNHYNVTFFSGEKGKTEPSVTSGCEQESPFLDYLDFHRDNFFDTPKFVRNS